MKILHVDIETAPNLAHVWSLWKQNVSLNQLMTPGYILCWAAKWDGGKELFFDSIHQSTQEEMLAGIHRLLDEADAVVTYNGVSFDLPTLNGEFAQVGMTPPSPYHNIDLYLVARRQFKFPSHKLEFVARALGVGCKVKHEGHGLWVACMSGNDQAWQRMERYNRGDVRLQERVYRKILPWITTHPNHALYTDDRRPCCPNCGGTKVIRQGTRTTRVQRYARFQCKSCGAWSRDAKKDATSPPVPRRAA